MAEEIALCPVREDDLSMLEELTQDPGKTGEFEWFGWSDLRRWRQGWDENGLISLEGGTLIVTRGDERLGLVNWRRQPVTVPSSYCWEIGIMLLPEARGYGYGTQAQRLLARYLFAHPLAKKLHRDWRHISFARVLRTQALRTPGCCRARLPRHRPQPGQPSLHCAITGLPGRQGQGPRGERAVFRPGCHAVSVAGVIINNGHHQPASLFKRYRTSIR